MDSGKEMIPVEDLLKLKSSKRIFKILEKSNGSLSKKLAKRLDYELELERLQVELVRMQRWIQENDKRLVIIFEGRDAAGKGGAIRRFTEHLSPRGYKVVALPKPTEQEKGQWYFQRYVQQLPNEGQIVFFDRSWYNRAVVEPVNGFCTEKEYKRFMRQVPEFEEMLNESGIILLKLYFSISKGEQARRFASRKENPLKQWKVSPIDERAQELWDDYTEYKLKMFHGTHTVHNPWIIIKADKKKKARLEAIKYVLNSIPYDISKLEEDISNDPDYLSAFHPH
jgi:polyphosphate kinase 2